MNAPALLAEGIGHRYGDLVALHTLGFSLPAGTRCALIGPDGAGKSTLLGLIAGVKRLQQGELQVLGGSIRQRRHRAALYPKVAFMPQGLGNNLYPELSISENIRFFATLFGLGRRECEQRMANLLQATDLQRFAERPAGKLSGGMKQKLGLCCALIHDPDLLILDEPTTGVDPLARAQFWDLIERIRRQRPAMSVMVATAYMDEAQRFHWLVAMDEGRVLATGAPQELLARTGCDSLEDVFIALMPEEKKRGHQAVVIPPLQVDDADVAIEAQGLTMRFGDFTAVDHVNFRIRRGEIFGFLGSNGCGKSTTMKMLTGLLPASDGQAWLFGKPVDPHDIDTRRRVGYMSQAFSLYGELTVRQNLVLHAQLFHVPADQQAARVQAMVERFELQEVLDALPESLPLGVRQRLSLAVAMVHQPELLILDEPTSGVDPIARDRFWQLLADLSRRDRVTIFISTHFMNEAARCDRMSMMHAGRVLDSDRPAALIAKRGAATLEEAFIGYLVEAGGDAPAADDAPPADTAQAAPAAAHGSTARGPVFSLQRLFSYLWREALELQRDPVRAAMALLGSLVLMFVISYGITLDVENLSYAVLDRDRTQASQNYALNLSGSRYFIERPPIVDEADLDRRMRSGELSLAIEIPPGFGRDMLHGRPVQIGAWIDGAMPQRAETIRGYVGGLHQQWLAQQLRERGIALPQAASIETRFRYNPDVKSLPAMVPAVIALLLLMLPAMLTALAVVREKELGSIINLYVTPVTRLEFLVGKQLPYVGLAMVNFLLMCAAAITVFGVPITGSFWTLALAACVYAIVATGIGLVASAITNSQSAAMFIALVVTLVPSVQFSGLLHPVTSLEGAGRWIGEVFPATYMLIVSRGVFSKGLGLHDLMGTLVPLLIAVPVVMGAAVALLKKQES